MLAAATRASESEPSKRLKQSRFSALLEPLGDMQKPAAFYLTAKSRLMTTRPRKINRRMAQPTNKWNTRVGACKPAKLHAWPTKQLAGKQASQPASKPIKLDARQRAQLNHVIEVAMLLAGFRWRIGEYITSRKASHWFNAARVCSSLTLTERHIKLSTTAQTRLSCHAARKAAASN